MTTMDMEVMVGEHISRAAERAVSRAKSYGAIVRFKFNDLPMEVSPHDAPGDVEARYDRASAERRAAYEASPEGQRARREHEALVLSAQAEVDLAVVALDGLDFRDVNAVVAWCERIAKPADLIGVNVPREQILDWFKMHGWTPNMNCGAAFNGEDRDNFAGYIIGQVLDGIERHGVPHPIVHRFAEQWREKFGG